MTESILLKYEKFIIGYEKEGRRIMEILGKVLSEKTEAIYKDITEGLIYPIKIVKLDPENEEDESEAIDENGETNDETQLEAEETEAGAESDDEPAEADDAAEDDADDDGEAEEAEESSDASSESSEDNK